MPAAVAGRCGGVGQERCHAALPRELAAASRSGARGDAGIGAATPRKKSARNSRAVVGTSAQAHEGPWQGRQRRGRFNLYCSSSHGNQLSCAQFQLFLTPPKERRGLLRAGRDRPAAMAAERRQPWGSAPGAGAVAPGRRGRGQEGRREPGSGPGRAGGAVRCRSLPPSPRASRCPRGTGWRLEGPGRARRGTSCGSTKPSAGAAPGSRQPPVSIQAGG